MLAFIGICKEVYKKSMESDNEGEECYLPTMGSLELARADEQAWKWTMTYILPMVEAKRYKTEGPLQPFSQWCNPTSEAFAFIVVLNSYEAWKEEAKYGRKGKPKDKENTTNANDKGPTPTQWTNKSANGKMFEGWTQEGINAFNKMVEKIKDHRKTEEGEALEKEMTKIIYDRASKGRSSIAREKGPEYQSPQVDLPEGFIMPSKKKRRTT